MDTPSPTSAAPWVRRARAVPSLFVGTLVTALAAQASFPLLGSPVPQSLQTLAVVVVGGILGPGPGGLAMVLYVGLGVAGLPVFADGASGAARLWGPTGGYLAGFVVGAMLAGWWVRRPWGRSGPALVVGAAAAHVVILGMGWVRLAAVLGPAGGWSQGVEPFLWGGMVKSLAAAAILAAWARWDLGWNDVRTGGPGGPEPVEPGSPPV